MIDFESALVYFDCPMPPGSDAHAMYECGACDGDGGIAVHVGTLFANLGIAAGLTKSFLLGHSRGLFRPTIDDSRVIVDEYERTIWKPGCGRQAP